MPIPTPNTKETKNEFISRCMSSDVMKSEFPDTEQRAAVCISKWNKKSKSSEESDNDRQDKTN